MDQVESVLYYKIISIVEGNYWIYKIWWVISNNYNLYTQIELEYFDYIRWSKKTKTNTYVLIRM